MMLTDQELKDMHHLDQFGLFCDYDEFKQIACAVIKANNAKALAELKPVAFKLTLIGGAGGGTGFTRSVEIAGRTVETLNTPPLYSADTVSALIQRNEALEARVKKLEAWLEGDATCPCCGQSVTCLDGCTFATDAPHDNDKMQEVRNVLKVTP